MDLSELLETARLLALRVRREVDAGLGGAYASRRRGCGLEFEELREFTDRVQSGSADFSMLARLYSEDTESAKRGGELGFVGKGQLVSEFADVAFNLNDPKRVSRIVQTEYGYHIIQSNEFFH